MEKESKIIRVNSQQPLTLLNWEFSEMNEFVTLDSVFADDIFPNFGHLVLKNDCIYFLGNCNAYD